MLDVNDARIQSPSGVKGRVIDNRTPLDHSAFLSFVLSFSTGPPSFDHLFTCLDWFHSTCSPRLVFHDEIGPKLDEDTHAYCTRRGKTSDDMRAKEFIVPFICPEGRGQIPILGRRGCY
ncbi:unnamed protein product, partial [Ectocarpus sp. 8 AP-2014]